MAFGAHLLGQPAQKYKQRIPGLNPAQVRNKGILGNDLWAVLPKIFCHENSSKYLSSHVLIVQVKDLLELLLSSQSVRVIAFTRFMSPGCTLLFSCLATCQLS